MKANKKKKYNKKNDDLKLKLINFLSLCSMFDREHFFFFCRVCLSALIISLFSIIITTIKNISFILIPKSLFGNISVPSSDIQASTDTKSVTNEGKLHFNKPALPRNTNSSITRV